ncbi:hypothetical protein [Pseudomonas sp. C9]|uniref:hypothetical protein n=1 Tax=Pseudomonas sp. C9 TaxID=1311337 RepID=UPI00158D2B06|nr:hypothetical protein [Pseudomonas sp. C9]
MNIYAQLKDGEIVTLFSSPQLEENCPGVQELQSDDPRVVAFVEERQIKGLIED